jgi:excisionase family DNA binding protein
LNRLNQEVVAMHISKETPLALRIPEACQKLGISRSTLWKYAKQGKIRLIHIGGRTLVSHAEAVRLSTEGAR